MGIEALLPALPLQEAIGQLRADVDFAASYVDRRVMRVTPSLNVQLVSDAWRSMHGRWQALRSELVEHQGKWVQVVHDSAPSVIFEALEASSFSERARNQIIHDVAERHVHMLMPGQPAALGLIGGPGHSIVVMSWRHELLDGTAVATLLDELRLRCDGQSPMEGPSSLVDLARELRGQRPIEIPASLGSVPPDLTAFGGNSARAVVSSVHRLDGRALHDLAAESKTTSAVVATAAWTMALARRANTRGFVITAEDCRPAGFRGVPGMFTGIAAAWLPSGTTTLRQAAERLRESRTVVVGRRPVSMTDLLRPLRRAGTAGMPDVLLTIHPGNVERTGIHRWERLSASERTEFALSIDVLLDAEVTLHVHRDPHRVDEATESSLVADVHDILAAPDLRESDVVSLATRRAPIECEADASLVVAVLTDVLDVEGIVRTTDITALDISSLDVMRSAIALCEAGVNVSVSTLFLERTPERIAAAAGGLQVTSATAVTSPVERSLLQRTGNDHHGQSPMHEQSIITVDHVLNPDVFHDSLLHVAQTIGVVDARWDMREAWTIASAGGPVAFSSETLDADDDVEVFSREVLGEDLRRGFGPGDQLYRCWLVRGPKLSAIVASWHNAILDGWSTATLFRLIHDSYRALETGQSLPSPSGASIEAYRRWCNRDHERSRVAWREYLSGATLPRRGEPLDAHRRKSGRRFVMSLEQVVGRAPSGTTMTVNALALAAEGLRDVYGYSSTEPIGMRVGLRPPALPRSFRMVGQATLEAPIRIDHPDVGGRALIVQSSLGLAREHGHVGEVGIKQAVGCPPTSDLYRGLVVSESDLPEDEWVVRRGSAHAWREVSAWRREVSPSVVTTYVHTDDQELSIEVSAPDGDVDTVCKAVTEAMQRQAGS